MPNYQRSGGSGLLIHGQRVQVPGPHPGGPNLDIVNFLDEPAFKMSHEDGEPRGAGEHVRLIVMHTTTGEMPQHLIAGQGPAGDLAERNAISWANEARCAAAHLLVDGDGSWVQTADLLDTITYHAGSRPVNHGSIGIEIAIPRSGNLYESQMYSLVAMLDFLTRHPEIQVPRQYAKSAWPIADIGTRFRGIIAHRDVGGRTEGDCGPTPYTFVDAAGYQGLDVVHDEHITLWKTRQAFLNQQLAGMALPTPHTPLVVDGDPGPATWAAAKLVKPPYGQWVHRPGD